MTKGFYICYEDSDSRVMPYYPGENIPPAFFATELEVEPEQAPYARELEATQALLAYFESLHNDLVDCIVSTKTKIRMLETENK